MFALKSWSKVGTSEVTSIVHIAVCPRVISPPATSTPSGTGRIICLTCGSVAVVAAVEYKANNVNSRPPPILRVCCQKQFQRARRRLLCFFIPPLLTVSRFPVVVLLLSSRQKSLSTAVERRLRDDSCVLRLYLSKESPRIITASCGMPSMACAVFVILYCWMRLATILAMHCFSLWDFVLWYCSLMAIVEDGHEAEALSIPHTSVSRPPDTLSHKHIKVGQPLINSRVAGWVGVAEETLQGGGGGGRAHSLQRLHQARQQGRFRLHQAHELRRVRHLCYTSKYKSC